MRMRYPLLALSLCAIAGLLACTTPNRSPAGHQSTVTQLEPDLFKVLVRGQPYEPSAKLHDLALVRAADLVQQHGFACFSIVNESNPTDSAAVKSPGTALNSGSIQSYASGAYFTGHSTYTPGKIYDSGAPGTTLLVRGYHTPPKDIAAFNAASVKQELGNKYPQ